MNVNKLYLLILIAILIGFIQVVIYTPKIQSNYVSLSQGNLAYNEYGENTSNIVILIHGSPGSKDRDFNLLAPEIKNSKVYTLDMYGFGESERFIDDYGISAQADVVKEFMDSKNIKRATLIGYSWGAGVTEEFAYKYPESIDKMILLAGMGIQEGEPTGSHFLEKTRAQFSYPFVVFYPGAFAGNAYWKHGFLMSFIDSDQRPIREHMKQIKTQTLILQGENDKVIPNWVAEEHHNLLSNSILVYYNGGHGELFSNVTEIAEIINYYLSDQSISKGKVSLEVES